MEDYGAETKEILRRFLARKLSFPDCIAMLDAALSSLIQRPQTATAMVKRSGSLDLAEIRAIMLANNDVVMDEMARRKLTNH
jgi:hypothetical protein